MRLANLADHDLLLLVQRFQTVRPQQEKRINRRLRRLHSGRRLVAIVIENHEASHADQSERLDGVFENVTPFVVPVDVGKLEPRSQQRQRPPRFGLEFADL